MSEPVTGVVFIPLRMQLKHIGNLHKKELASKDWI